MAGARPTLPPLLLVLLLALLLGGGLASPMVWWSGDPPGQEAQNERPSPAEPAAAAGDPTVGSRAPGNAGSGASTRTAVQGKASQPPRVTVLQAATGAAVEAAEVHYLRTDQSRQGAGPLILDRKDVPRVLVDGHRTRTGADGVAVLTARLGEPAPSEPHRVRVWTVVARKGDRLAAGVVAAAPGARLKLQLEADQTLRIRVRGPGGAPVPELPVHIAQRVRTAGPPGDAGFVERVQLQHPTDADGIATFPHWQLWSRKRPLGPGEQPAGHLARPGIPLAQDVSVDIPPELPDSQPLELRCPPLGTVEVRVLDPLGGPLRAPAVVALRPEGRCFGPGILRSSSAKGAPPGTGQAPVHRFPMVGLGLRFHVRAEVGYGALSRRDAPGPTRPGGVCRIDLGPDPGRHICVVGRLLRAGDGAESSPTANGSVPFDLPCGMQTLRPGGYPVRRRVEPQPDGRFATILDRTAVWPEALLFRPQEAPQDLLARVDLRGVAATDHLQLGDVILRVAPILADGVVVDDTGAPLDNVEVTVEQPPASRGTATSDQARWLPLALLQATTDERGRFTVRGSPPNDRPCRLVFTDDTHAKRRSAPFLPPGPRGIEVVLPRNGSLRITARAGPLRRDTAVEVRVLGDAWSVRSRLAFREGFGSWQSRSVPPGRYRVQVTLAGWQQPVLDVGDVVVPPGAAAGDPRLQDVELDAGLHAHGIRLEVAGMAQPPALAWLIFDEGFAQQNLEQPAILFRAAGDTVWLPTSGARAIVHAPGLLPKPVALAPGEQTIPMAPARSTQVTLAPALPDLQAILGVAARYELVWVWMAAPEWPMGIHLPARVAYLNPANGGVGLLRLPAKGSSHTERVALAGAVDFPFACGGDGRFLLRVRLPNGRFRDVGLASVTIPWPPPAQIPLQLPEQELQEVLGDLVNSSVADQPTRTPR